MATTPPANRLETIDSNLLTPLVRKTLNRDDLVVVDWHYKALHGASFNSEIYRFSGNAQGGEDILPWSLVLKMIRSEDGTNDPGSLSYWKREALAYQSELLDNLPGGICAPRCFEVVEQPGLEAWLWLEEVVDELPASWPLEQYGKVAQALAQFNGAYLEERQLPTQAWLARGRLRAWVDDPVPAIPVPAEVLAHPLVSRYYPEDIYQRLLGARGLDRVH
jgi:hypothetical protein